MSGLQGYAFMTDGTVYTKDIKQVRYHWFKRDKETLWAPSPMYDEKLVVVEKELKHCDISKRSTTLKILVQHL